MSAFRNIIMKSSFKSKLIFIFGIIVISILLFIGTLAEYLVSEYINCSHNYDASTLCTSCMTSSQGKIPHHLHQIFFFETSDSLPEDLKIAQNSWILHHPNYTYTLWNKTSIENLIEKEYPNLRKLYHSYGHWVRRADVARYLVLYHYGGWYVDLDVSCKQSLLPLERDADHLNKTVIVRDTEPVGFSNDFIGITKHHPFLYSVLNSLHYSNRWYVFPYANTMFSTGPMFLWGRYLNFPGKGEFLSISNSTYSQYITLLHKSSWHSWDGKIVWFFFNDRRKLCILLAVLACVLCFLVFCCKYRSYFATRCSTSYVKPNGLVSELISRHLFRQKTKS